MSDSMLMPPNMSQYRFALYCCGHRMDLTFTPQPPIALYSDEQMARAHGARMWPTTYEVIDIGSAGGCEPAVTAMMVKGRDQ